MYVSPIFIYLFWIILVNIGHFIVHVHFHSFYI